MRWLGKFGVALALILILSGGAHAQSSCLSGPTYLRNSWLNLSFVNGCTGEAVISLRVTHEGKTEDRTIPIRACSIGTFQTWPNADVAIQSMEASQREGRCVDGTFVPPQQPVATPVAAPDAELDELDRLLGVATEKAENADAVNAANAQAVQQQQSTEAQERMAGYAKILAEQEAAEARQAAEALEAERLEFLADQQALEVGDDGPMTTGAQGAPDIAGFNRCAEQCIDTTRGSSSDGNAYLYCYDRQCRGFGVDVDAMLPCNMPAATGC